jgi:hypothetical protein
VYYSGSWGTVCDDSWDIDDGNVVCRELGYGRSMAVYQSARYGQGSGRIWMDDVRCTGSETRLSNCAFNGWGNHDCSHSEDASVVCSLEGELFVYYRQIYQTCQMNKICPWIHTMIIRHCTQAEGAFNWGWDDSTGRYRRSKTLSLTVQLRSGHSSMTTVGDMTR